MASPSYSDFQTISIDFDVFKKLTEKLESPSDSYNAVLRRLLELQQATPAEGSRTEPEAKGWAVRGATFPNGTEFRAKYKGYVHTARVEDGALAYNGERYDSPSSAAGAITGNSVNGWIFWECRLPGRNAWVRIDSLRQK